MNDNRYLSIGAITKYLKNKFDTDEHLKSVYLKGEISNFKAHSSGHLYFSLKDEFSKISAIMFRGSASKLLFLPNEGMNVLVKGRITLYEPTGNYQIYVEEMLEDGLGDLYKKFELLKKKLNLEGLFSDEHKVSIPKYPSKIGVVTAPTGAAIRDILTTIKRRYPLGQIYVFPSLVQGEMAANDIANKIKEAQDYNLDVLIVGRGGGSIEDLWAFNEEVVARSIFESKVPIISAVGHEVDFTISDFVADLRAPTPTAAAELAVPNIIDLKTNLNQLIIRLNENIYKNLNFKKLYLDSIKNSFVIKNPMLMFESKKQYLDNLIEKVNSFINSKVEKYKLVLTNIKNKNILINPHNLYVNKIRDLSNIMAKLEILNPISILKRGYTLTYINNNIINSVRDVQEGFKLKVRFYDGYVITSVIKRREEDDEGIKI